MVGTDTDRNLLFGVIALQIDVITRAQFLDGCAIWANQNYFGNPDASAATKIKFQRLSQPVLRREGVSVGVVEWQSDLMIGTNKARERDTVYYNGQKVTQVPQSTVIARGNVHTELFTRNDELDVTPEVP